jgi:hypothetical protein
MPKNDPTPEQIVTSQVKDWLAWRKWRAIRMQRTAIPGAFSTGEPGIPDFLFLKYLDNGVALALWIEFKRPGGKLRDGQPEWHERERKVGAIVWVVDDFDDFERRYMAAYGWLEKKEGRA